jgi:hypothetical protein
MQNPVWDIYADNCFIMRLHYQGMVDVLKKRLSDAGHVVRVVQGFIEC